MATSDQGSLFIDISSLEDPNKLSAALEPLRSLGFPIHSWSDNALGEHYLTPDYFIKMIRIVTTIHDESVRADVLSFGITKGFWNQNILCDPMAMLNFCRWLRTPEGKKDLINAQKRPKLRKRARPGQDLSTVAFVQILSQQLLDFAKEKTKKKPDVEFRPASEYYPPGKLELEKRCFDMYEEECRGKNLKADAHDLALPYVIKKYSNAAREAHMFEFCSSDERKVLLRGYAEKKIRVAEQVGGSRLVSNLRFYLAASGEEKAPEGRVSKARKPIAR